jgi:selenide,water dikinase
VTELEILMSHATTIKRLTEYATCAGCAGKIPPLAVAEILRSVQPRGCDPNVLVGTETSDDAGVYRVAEGLAVVQTVDFFPPLVDDPYTFGKIAATNALSDVYAMNGRPITALNIVMFPDDELPLAILGAILRGGGDQVAASGAVTLGGHSLRDREIKFGLSVTGLVDPTQLLTNASARVGDVLVLTKPLGTGLVTTAHKKGKCPGDLLDAGVASMTQLNAVGRDALNAAGGPGAVSSVTDVTGFGLAGHALEMAEGAGVTIELDLAALPLLPGSEALAEAGFFTRASRTNREFVGDRIEVGPSAHRLRLEYLFDAQTSGGLLIAIHPDHADRLVHELRDRGALAASRVGRVRSRRDSKAIVVQ